MPLSVCEADASSPITVISTAPTEPNGSLTLIGSSLYGTDLYGGGSGGGSIFTVNTNGTDFEDLYSFSRSSGGDTPCSGLTLTGSAFYGATWNGGSGTGPGTAFGTIFRVGTDGSGFTVLHSFYDVAGDVSGGIMPAGSPVVSGTTLYDVCNMGGAAGYGMVFKMGIDGSGFTNLHSFAGGADGAFPFSMNTLSLSGSALYGTTNTADWGPNSSDNGLYYGTIFKVGTSGSGYQVLHTFAGGVSDGANPTGGLVLSGSTLYGVASGGGSNNDGVLFRVNVDGTGFGLLHSFAGADGQNPFGALTLVGSSLYGSTTNGGAYNDGTIFKIGTDGTGFQMLASFDGTDGEFPEGGLVFNNSTLYGAAQQGGPGIGTLFAITVPEPSTFILFSIGTITAIAYAWRRRMAS
ncbi:MAG: choice-of-anchor tandem repeat GloVer-containing protein [Thermoguttaceae bacterium]